MWMRDAMRYLITAMLLVAGVIHLLPLSGVLGAPRLSALYGVQIEDPNLLILMRHRAVLFALLGAFLVCAAFKPSLQRAAIAAGLVSAISFLWLTLTAPDYNANLTTVLYADIVAIACLFIAAASRWRRPRAI